MWNLEKQYCCYLVAKSCPTLCNIMDCSLLGSFVHEISQARILEYVAISFSMESFWPQDWTWVSSLAGGLLLLLLFFTSELPEKNGTKEPFGKAEIETQMLRTHMWTPRREKVGVGWIGKLGLTCVHYFAGLPRWLSGKESACQCRRHRGQGHDPWVEKIVWRRKWQTIPVFLPREHHRQRSLAWYSPWSCRESDVTEWECVLTHEHKTDNCWEPALGTGSPAQCSVLTWMGRKSKTEGICVYV